MKKVALYEHSNKPEAVKYAEIAASKLIKMGAECCGTVELSEKVKPEIWKNRQEFEKLMSDFQEQITKLNQVAHSGDQAAVKEQFGVTAKSCKNCHDKFRKE